ncbi:hypothetical protein [Lacrimispora amygdalina]|uniref:hypothetical protein n=1 Tax=Lacrimispora amygdalina TaxID=253257 RepID=UPI000BE2598F|nr:hypothetical protein [Lacrimispora amygdalina]
MNEKCINTEAANVKKNGWIPAITIEFDEVTGYINNSWYDLDKLLIKLKADPNVIDRDEIKIQDVMDYDDEDGHTKAIAFKYLLPLEIYGKLADKESNFVRNYILKEVIKAGDCQIEF